jgi:orotate phosphoribosyltransferase
MIDHAPFHTRRVFYPTSFKVIVEWAAEKMRAHPEWQAIAGIGQSGLLLAGALGYQTGKPVIAVRKDGEPIVAGVSTEVSARLPYGDIGYVFVEDFIASGGTFTRLVTAIHDTFEPHHGCNPYFAGALFYGKTSVARIRGKMEELARRGLQAHPILGRPIYVYGDTTP